MPRRPLAALLALVACDSAPPPIDPPDQGPPPIVGAPALDRPCEGPPEAPRFLAVTTTDFTTGALSIVDVEAMASTPDVALASSDAKPFAHEGLLYVLHRYQLDALDVIDPAAEWALVDSQAIDHEGPGSANPHAIAFADDGLAYVSFFGAPAIAVYDLADPAHPRRSGTIALGAVADADGNPEASLAIACGDALFVTLERLDRDAAFAPREDHDEVAVIDRASGRLHDLDADAPGIQGIELRGLWARQWRRDPDDPRGTTLLVLTEGIERLDLAAGESTWLVAPALLEGLGIRSYLQPQAFALHPASGAIYLASYREDFSEVVVHRVDPAAEPEAAAVEVLSGLMTSEQTLEVIGDTLWIGDRTPGAAGIRAYAIDPSSGALSPRLDAPLATGLAPYALSVVP